MKRLLALILAVLMCISLVACGGAPATEAPATDAPATDAPADAPAKTGVLKIGSIHDLTGNGSVLGIASVNGHEIAIKEINEAGGVVIGDTTYTLELVSYDCKSDPNEGISSLQRLVNVDDVSIVMGPSLSNVGLATVPYTDELEVAFLGQFGDPRCMQGENLDSLNKYMFLMQPSASQSGVQAASYLAEVKGVKKMGFLIAQDHAYCSTQANAALKYCEDMGIEVVIEYNNQADLDMKTQLTNLMNAGCDGLFNANPTQPLTVATNQKHQLGWDVPQGGSLDFSSPFAGLCADAATASNIYFVSNTAYEDEEFIALDAKCREMFGQEATIKTALGYDQIYIAVAAAQAAGSADRNAIRDALETIENVDTSITDTFNMDPKTHMPLGLDVCIYNIDNGEYIFDQWWSPDYLK